MCNMMPQATGAAAGAGAGAGGHQRYWQVHSAEDSGGQAQTQPGAARGGSTHLQQGLLRRCAAG